MPVIPIPTPIPIPIPMPISMPIPVPMPIPISALIISAPTKPPPIPNPPPNSIILSPIPISIAPMAICPAPSIPTPIPMSIAPISISLAPMSIIPIPRPISNIFLLIARNKIDYLCKKLDCLIPNQRTLTTHQTAQSLTKSAQIHSKTPKNPNFRSIPNLLIYNPKFLITNRHIRTMLQKKQLASHKKRENTDTICLIIFVSITLVLLIAALYCYFTGSITKLDVPYDPDAKGCALDYPDHPYIYFPSPQYDSLWVTTCVKKCPTQSDTTLDCQPNSLVPACTENNSVDNKKAFHIYSTQVFRGSVCLPTDSAIREKVFAGIKAPPLEEMFRTVLRDWSLLLLMVPIVIVMVLVAMVLIRLTAGYVIYVLYAVAITSFIGFGIFLAVPTNSAQVFILKKDKAVSATFSALSFIIASIILCVFCSYRAKIKAAVKFIDQSNQFCKDNYYLLVLPFILIGFLVLFIIFWTFLTLSFYSMSMPVRQPNQLPFEHYKLTAPLIALLLGNLFYLIWGVFFLMHTGSFIVSGTVVNWQYNRSHPYLSSSKSYLSSHMGSVCLGSFLTTLLGLFKFELDEADCAQRQQQKEKKCIDWVKSCYGCLCCCCVNFVFKCFHHAAYVYQNLTGLTYCHSSSQIYQVIREQKEEWSIIAFLYLIFDQFIPLTFTAISTLIANSLINAIELYRSGTANCLVILLVVVIISYSICQFFIGIYSQTIQSLFVVQQFHNNLLANPDQMRLKLSEANPKEVSEKAQVPSQRYSLFSKNS